MTRTLAILAFALTLGACSLLQPNATVSTVKAQQTLDVVQSAHRAALQAEVLYILQPGCGLPASPPPPLCASLAVGRKMQDLDTKATKAIATAQTAIDTAGANPTVVDAAIAAAKLAVAELQNFTTANGAKP